MSATLQRRVRQSLLYHRCKASPLYNIYCALSRNDAIHHRTAEIDFYRRLLTGFQPGDLIFDIGANEGYKAEVFLELDARVVCVEPDVENLKALRAKFHRYRFHPKPVEIV